jgi:hypothetical protein
MFPFSPDGIASQVPEVAFPYPPRIDEYRLSALL